MSEWKETDIGNIPSNWDYGCLLDIASKEKKAIISGPFGSNISRKYFVDKGVPIIRGNNLSLNIGQRFLDNNFVYVTEDKAEDLNTWATVDDLVFTAAGTIGQVGIIAHGQKYRAYIISNKQLRVTVDSSKMLPIFAYYWFASNFMQDWIASCDTGSTIPLINLSVLKSLPVPVPPLPEQRAIASVLSSLDDKIDLLHRQNKTLEAMAETLFRQWFVEEADEGWEEGTLGDVIELIYGKGLKKEIRTGTGYPVIGSSGVVGYHSEFLVEGPGIVIGRKGTLGKVSYLWDNFFPIDTTYYIKSKVESAGLLYEYFLLKTLNFEEMNSDSAVPGLNRDIALSTEIKIAPLEKLNKFNQFTSTFINKLRDNTKQIRTLEKLRDMLLPKLTSGEVRVDL